MRREPQPGCILVRVISPGIIGGKLDQYLGDLSAEERKRVDRIRSETRARQIARRRILLRRTIQAADDIKASDITFSTGPDGKPCTGHSDLRFNLSESHGWVAIALARGLEVGVDVEMKRPIGDAIEIARRYFSREETAAIDRLQGDERDKAFFRCWTRKEALMKADGRGMRGGLKTPVGVEPAPDDGYTVRFEGADYRLVDIDCAQDAIVSLAYPECGHAIPIHLAGEPSTL
jgi:4'-phosphopantetheinyl transferase